LILSTVQRNHPPFPERKRKKAIMGKIFGCAVGRMYEIGR
jgi:hypothetical protein